MSIDGDAPTGGAVIDPARIAREGGDRRMPSDLRALREAATHTSGCARCSWTRSGLTLKQARAAFLRHVSEAHPENFKGAKRDRRAKDEATRTAALARMREGNESASAIARDLGIGTNSVLRWARAAGLIE